MKQTAKVVNENGRLMAEVLRPEACEACKACKYGRQARHLVKLPPGDYREGDMVRWKTATWAGLRYWLTACPCWGC